MAQLYAGIGNQGKAEQELIIATQTDPENESLVHVLGRLYSVTRRLDAVEQLYLDLLAHKPNSLVAKKGLAELYAARSDMRRVRQYADNS